VNESCSIQELKGYFNGEFNSGIDSYFKKFQSSGVGFFTNQPELFIPVGTDYEVPFNVTNAIIEISDEYDYKRVIEALSDMSTHSLQIRFARHYDEEVILNILDFVYMCKFRFVDVLVNAEHMNEKSVMSIVNYSKFFDRLTVYNCIASGVHKKSSFVERPLKEGMLASMNFDRIFVSRRFFFEGTQKNPAFNKKVFVDSNGDIKNEVSHKRKFGNVKTNNISDVYNSIEFRRIWQISRDKIDKCSTCVFRFCCTFGSDVITYGADSHKLRLDCGVDEWHHS